jgi:hypothetical protein
MKIAADLRVGRPFLSHGLTRMKHGMTTMFRKNDLTGWALIKHTTWIGTKWLFLSLVAIIVLFWVAECALVFYRSHQLGISPYELLERIENAPDRSYRIYFGSSVVTFALGSLAFLAVTTFWGAVIFATIGSVAALFTKRLPQPTQADQLSTES